MKRFVWVVCITFVMGACGGETPVPPEPPVPDDEPQAPTCTDKVKNGSEADVDCGGSCATCTVGRACRDTVDCESGTCISGTCATAACTDGVKNGSESDTDCGGSCAACASGKRCTGAAECTSGVCTANSCMAPNCTDGVRNGSEADVDCGGTCPICAIGKACARGGDCATGVCLSSICAAASCQDGVKNGAETDVDCGGGCQACVVGKTCAVDAECMPNICTAGLCQYPASCADLKKRHPSATSGDYTLRMPNGGATVRTRCEMAIDGGGWTQMLQCLPSDGCKVGSVVLYNVDWLAQDYGTPSSSASHAIGSTLTPLIGGGHFMVEVTDTVASKVGHLIYPLSADTRKFFSSTAFYESAPLTMAVIDSDGGASSRALRICWGPTVSPYARSYQGISGLSFLGRSSVAPTANANSGCDYGSWQSQMLIRNPSLGSLTTMWGMAPVASWSAQPYAHRIYVREVPPAAVSIVQVGAGRRWSDGTYARSCNGYRNPPSGARVYQGATGNGIYTLKPDPARPAVDVPCEMTTDGGGWTLVQRTLWEWAASQSLLTSFASFYDTNVGTPEGAWRLAGRHWQQVHEKNQVLLVHQARKASTGQSCQPLYYKGTNAVITSDPAAKTLSLSGLNSSVAIADLGGLSTQDSGPHRECVNDYSGVPWFYGNCCSTCPTFKGSYWIDEPHPMTSYLATPDFFGKTIAQVCGSDPVITSTTGTFYGLNQMDVYLR